jgi:hypothetical protein
MKKIVKTEYYEYSELENRLISDFSKGTEIESALPWDEQNSFRYCVLLYKIKIINGNTVLITPDDPILNSQDTILEFMEDCFTTVSLSIAERLLNIKRLVYKYSSDKKYASAKIETGPDWCIYSFSVNGDTFKDIFSVVTKFYGELEKMSSTDKKIINKFNSKK